MVPTALFPAHYGLPPRWPHPMVALHGHLPRLHRRNRHSRGASAVRLLRNQSVSGQQDALAHDRVYHQPRAPRVLLPLRRNPRLRLLSNDFWLFRSSLLHAAGEHRPRRLEDANPRCFGQHAHGSYRLRLHDHASEETRPLSYSNSFMDYVLTKRAYSFYSEIVSIIGIFIKFFDAVDVVFAQAESLGQLISKTTIRDTL